MQARLRRSSPIFKLIINWRITTHFLEHNTIQKFSSFDQMTLKVHDLKLLVQYGCQHWRILFDSNVRSSSLKVFKFYPHTFILFPYFYSPDFCENSLSPFHLSSLVISHEHLLPPSRLDVFKTIMRASWKYTCNEDPIS